MNETAYFEDNNGADVIEIINNGDGTFTFLVGNCCVFVMNMTGTITEITAWLTELAMKVHEEEQC